MGELILLTLSVPGYVLIFALIRFLNAATRWIESRT
jgi:hypothetical protein